MNTQATERFLMKRDFAHDTSRASKPRPTCTPSRRRPSTPTTSAKQRGVGSRASFSPHPLTGQDEDDIERMRKEFDEVFAF